MHHPLSATLVSLGDAPNIRVDSSILLIGRSSDCDIVVDSKKVSRKHCCIAIVNNSYLVVRDLGSTNGVRVNGHRQEEARLREGDEVTIANLPYRVQWDRPDDNRAPRPARVTDSLIERCDQPIALPDSMDDDDVIPVKSGRQGGAVASDRAKPPAREAERQRDRPTARDSFFQVPDDVKLAPASDEDLHV